jgi:hypothetical protein
MMNTDLYVYDVKHCDRALSYRVNPKILVAMN